MKVKPDTFMRFVLLRKNVMSGVPDGLFTTAYKLKGELVLNDGNYEWLVELLTWFDGNLDAPIRFNRSKSKGSWQKNSRGISWFKVNAVIHIGKMREIARILSEYGYITNEIKTVRPGYIVYEDEFQIVAEPFSETPIK